MFYNGNQFSDLEKAEAFNNFFVSVFAAKIGYNNSAPPSSQINLHEVDISPNEIHDALLSCDDSTSTGSDQIPSFVLRSCANILTPAICSLFSWVLKNKKWPQGWKIHTLLRYTSQTRDLKLPTIGLSASSRKYH